MKLRKTLILSIITISILYANILLSQQENISVQKINDQLYQVTGGGSNSFFYISNYEVVVIDAKISTDYAKRMLEEINKITEKPVRYLLITHHDGDHTRGIPVFQPPVNIFMHKNAYNHLKEFQKEAKLNLDKLNIITFEKSINIQLSNDNLKLIYFGPGHTDGDIVIYIPKYKTVILGDLFFKSAIPYLHPESGGNTYELEKVLKQICKLEIDIVLSGHSEISSKKDLLDELNYLVKLQSLVSDFVNNGKTLDETIKGIPIDIFKNLGGFKRESSFKQNIIDFYNRIKKEK